MVHNQNKFSLKQMMEFQRTFSTAPKKPKEGLRKTRLYIFE
jgi:hypothetical protein